MLLEERVTSKHDVFAFAILCWEMFEREIPYADMDDEQVTTYTLIVKPYTLNSTH